MSAGVQGVAYRLYSAIHHVRRRHDICAGFGQRSRGLCNQRDARVILNFVMLTIARNTATRAKLTSIARDASGPDARIKDDTAASYVQALRR